MQWVPEDVPLLSAVFWRGFRLFLRARDLPGPLHARDREDSRVPQPKGQLGTRFQIATISEYVPA